MPGRLKDKVFAITKHNIEDKLLQSLGRIRHTKLMIHHAVIASKNGASKIIVHSPDSDTVFVN